MPPGPVTGELTGARPQLIEAYLAERPTLAAVAILVDARREAEPEEQALIVVWLHATLQVWALPVI